jgi:hypothetical protein
MLMIVMSLAISIFTTSSFYSLTQSKDSNQKSQSSSAQKEKKESTYPTVLNVPSDIVVQPVALPPGDNSWAVQIVSRGGYTGSGRGDLTLTSDGLLIWDGPDGACSRRLSDDKMNALTEVVLSVGDSASLSERALAGLCFHCYMTAMIVQRQGVKGVVSVSWDDVTQAKIPAAIVAVYESLMAQRGCKQQ